MITNPSMIVGVLPGETAAVIYIYNLNSAPWFISLKLVDSVLEVSIGERTKSCKLTKNNNGQ